MAIELATAYVSILPSTSKLAPAVRGELSRVEKDADKTGKRAGGLLAGGFKKALLVGGGVLAGGGLLAAGKKLAGSASDLAESVNAVTVTYGKQAQGVLKLSEDAARGLGLSSAEFNSLSVRFSAFAKTVGGGGKATVTTLDDMTTRAADFASVMNLDVNEAAQIFQSGLAGESEPLRRFGIDMSAAAVTAKAYADGIAEAGKPLTEQQKVQARYALLMKQTAKTQDDFINTSGGAANQGRILSKVLQDMAANIGQGLLPTVEKVGAFLLDTAIPAVESWVEQWKNSEGPVGAVRKILAGLMDVAGGVIRFLRDWADVLVPIAVGLGAVTAVMKAGAILQWLKGIKLVTAVTKVWTGVQAAFNAVMALNPIGLVILALAGLVTGLVIAYKKSETFREVVDKAWASIKRGVKAAWEGVIRPALTAFWGFIQDDLIPVVKRLWNDVVKPAMAGIGKIIKSVWDNVIRPILGLWWKYVTNVLAPTITWLWKKVVGPAFEKIGAVIKWAWQKVAKPALSAMMDFLTDRVVPAFEKAADYISRFWSGLRSAATVAVRFVVGTIWNNGLRKVLNWIPGVNVGRVSLPASSNIRITSPSAPSGYAGGGYTGAGGKYDPAGVVHRDEFVVRSEARGRFERKHPGALAFLNNYGYLPGFAGGGRVWPTADRTPTTYPGHDGLDFGMPSGSPIWAAAPGVISYVGWGRGYGLATFQRGPYGELVYGHQSRALVRAGQSVAAGQRIGDVGSTGRSTGPHLHFGFPGGTFGQALGFLQGAKVSGGGGGVLGWIGDAVSKAREVWSAIKGMSSDGWMGTMRDAMFAVAGDIKDWINDKIPGPGPLFGIFDQGGVLEPGGVAVNASSKPEAIFNHRQFREFADTRQPASGWREMRITNWDKGIGFIREIADDAAQDRAAFAATTRRMAG